MLTKEQYLLTQLGSEGCEVSHRCSKAIQFSLSEVQEGQTLDNHDRLRDEIMDFVGTLVMLEEEGILSFEGVEFDENAAIDAKKAKVRKYMEYARKQGTLENEREE